MVFFGARTALPQPTGDPIPSYPAPSPAALATPFTAALPAPASKANQGLLVTIPPARLALVHGPEGFADRMLAVLAAPDLQVVPAATSQDIADGIASGSASVVVVDWSRLARLDVPALQAASRNGARASFVALDCPDAAAVGDALAAGASLAGREDATEAEIRSLVRISVDGRELARECESAGLELRRHAGLLMKDDLTSAYNRRFFDRFLAEQIENARPSRGKPAPASVGLVFMDIDNLKAVNVRHGHSMGSHVLREAAARLMSAVDADDRVTRYGGDEFCIVMPGRDSATALAVAERVRQAFAARPFAAEETGGVMLTASFGVACFPDHAADAAALVRAADAAMLSIKDQKNGIQLAGAP